MASIAGQTLLPAEVVVVDDGSTDGTVHQLENWTEVLPLTLVKLDTNSGPAAARNVGVAHATQPLINFVDADDVLLPDHLAVLCSVFNEKGGVIIPRLAQWEPGTREALRLPKPTWLRNLKVRSFYQISPPEVEKQRNEILHTNFVSSVLMMERNLYEVIGGMNTDDSIEDWDLGIRLVHFGVPIFTTASVTYLYRLSRGGLQHNSQAPQRALNTILRALEMDLSPDERQIAKKTAKRLRANVRLAEAYEFARQGNTFHARISGFRSLSGQMPVKLRASAVLMFPIHTTNRRDRG
jgi:glycosyltransferase involved in cell wall biosynthesis